jgi:seryl-tRNA synthetase
VAKPQHTFMLIKGKAKVAAEAADSRAKTGASKSEQLINAADYLLQKAKVEPSKLPTGLKILEAAKKASKEKIDETFLGKVKEVVEAAKKLAEQYEKLDSQEKAATAELQRPTIAVLRVPDMTPKVGLKEYINALDVVIILFTILIKLRAKGTR